MIDHILNKTKALALLAVPPEGGDLEELAGNQPQQIGTLLPRILGSLILYYKPRLC
jgi:hypothetical protein